MRLDIAEIEAGFERLSRGEFQARIEDLAAPAIELVTPPEQISTTECAARYRLIPDKEGAGASLWDADLTPYINGIQDALDDPEVGLVIVPKPARTGGTVAGENHLFKRLKFGPLTDVLWYLPSDSEVSAYTRRHVKKMFELHPDIAAKIGKARTDDTLTFKLVAGRNLEWLQLNTRTITNRDAGYIVGDEIDAANSKLIGTFVDQVKIRGTTAGASFKGFLCSHMEAGWTSGIAAGWKESSRGIWYWGCPHCGGYSSPCPTAPKGWRTVLDYERRTGVSDDEMLEIVEATAGLLCPHCGKKAADVHKPDMLLGGKWVHEGQTIARDGTITGEPASKKVMGFWIHGTMSPWVGLGDLAKRYVAALVLYERTKSKKAQQRLKQVTTKGLGEVYAGGSASAGAVDPVRLAERAADGEQVPGWVVPRGFLFVTAAVDVGGSKFDVLWRAWDLEGRSHVIARRTIRQRMIDGRPRDIRPAERQDDWLVLRDEVLKPLIPIEGDGEFGLPVAGMAIDTGDGHVTWKAREFARAMAREGFHWGARAPVWQRVRLIKGSKTATAPELPVTPREVNRDENGQKVSPAVKEYDLGVHKLKELAVERLAESEGGPGQVTFADDLPRSCFDELGGEVLIDGEWERRGPNETLDCMAYDEAVRQMLMPERAGNIWEPAERRPVWARPIRIEAEAGTAAAAKPAAKKKTIFEQIDDLNERDEEEER